MIFKGYTPFMITIKYWLYFLCYTIYPCMLFYTKLCVHFNLLPLYCPLPISPLVTSSLFSIFVGLLPFVVFTHLLYLDSTYKCL